MRSEPTAVAATGKASTDLADTGQAGPGLTNPGGSNTPGAQTSAEFFVPDLCAAGSVLVMVLLTELMVLVYALAVSDLPDFKWQTLAILSLFAQWVVLVSAALLCQLHGALSRMNLQRATLCSLVLVMAVSACTSVAAIAFYPQSADGSASAWWVFRNTLVAAVLTGIVLRYFYLQQQLQLREKSELQAHLDSLRARIRPHFLFNTMNSIASLIASRPAAAEQAVEDLAELFRESLQGGHRETTVAEEIHRCELYLGIERLRLGDRLVVEWSVDPLAEAQPMPSMVLQPLIENAVYHGVAQLPQGGTVAVAVHSDEGRIDAIVENPVPEKASGIEGNRIAQLNIRQLLRAHYGDQASFSTTLENGVYRAVLSYPVAEAR